MSICERGRCCANSATLQHFIGQPIIPYGRTLSLIHAFLPTLERQRETPAFGRPSAERAAQSERDRFGAFQSIYQAAKMREWTAAAKEDFLVRLSGRLGVDYGDIKKKRILHMISPEEAARMCAEGLDLQLHTHRHRVPRDASQPANELQDNVRIIEGVGARRPVHFCYPSGSYTPELEVWLRDNGVVSAATCEPGLVQRRTNPYFLPRMLDQENFAPVEFKGWLSGLFPWMTKRSTISEHGFQ